MAILTLTGEPEYVKIFKGLAPNTPFQTIRAIFLRIPDDERTFTILKGLIEDDTTLKDDTILTIIHALYPEVELHGPNPAITGRRFLNMKVTGQANSVSAFFQAVKEWQPPQSQETPIEKEAAPKKWWERIIRVLERQ